MRRVWDMVLLTVLGVVLIGSGVVWAVEPGDAHHASSPKTMSTAAVKPKTAKPVVVVTKPAKVVKSGHAQDRKKEEKKHRGHHADEPSTSAHQHQ